MRSLLLAVGFGLGFTGAALADPAVTVAPTYMRAQPNSYAPVVQSIPPNAEIDVNGCSGMWCAAAWRDVEGYVRLSALSFENAEPAPPPEPGYGYQPGPAVVIPFGFGPGGDDHRHDHEHHGDWGHGPAAGPGPNIRPVPGAHPAPGREPQAGHTPQWNPQSGSSDSEQNNHR